MNTCLYCQKETKTKFCSKSCATIFNNKNRKPRSLDSKQKTANSVKLSYIKNPKIKGSTRERRIWPRTKITRNICSCCNKEYWQRGYLYKVTCSPECARKNSTYRKIVHKFEHKGEILLLESKWEVEIANYLNSKNIDWIRPNHIPYMDSKGKHRKYFPDFYLPKYNLYLDPKNPYQIKISKEKLDIVSKQINLIYGTVQDIKTKLEILDSNANF